MRRDVLSVECKVKFDGPKISIQIGEEVVFSEQLYDNVDSSQVTVNCTKKRVGNIIFLFYATIINL